MDASPTGRRQAPRRRFQQTTKERGGIAPSPGTGPASPLKKRGGKKSNRTPAVFCGGLLLRACRKGNHPGRSGIPRTPAQSPGGGPTGWPGGYNDPAPPTIPGNVPGRRPYWLARGYNDPAPPTIPPTPAGDPADCVPAATADRPAGPNHPPTGPTRHPPTPRRPDTRHIQAGTPGPDPLRPPRLGNPTRTGHPAPGTRHTCRHTKAVVAAGHPSGRRGRCPPGPRPPPGAASRRRSTTAAGSPSRSVRSTRAPSGRSTIGTSCGALSSGYMAEISFAEKSQHCDLAHQLIDLARARKPEP
jgi:hypothetical protein